MVFRLFSMGVPVALLLWSLSSRRLGRWPRIVFAGVGLVLFCIAGLLAVEAQFLGNESWYNRSPWKEGLLLLTMLFGMAARSLDEAIEVRRQRIADLRKQGKLRRRPKLRLDLWDFSRPFLVSLATFGGLLSQIGEQSMGWAVVVLAFQTGFFWQTILKKGESALSA